MSTNSDDERRKYPSLEELGLDEPAKLAPLDHWSKISIDELQRESAREQPDKADHAKTPSTEPPKTTALQPRQRDSVLTQVFKLAVIGLAFCVIGACGLGGLFLANFAARLDEFENNSNLEKPVRIARGKWPGAVFLFHMENLEKLQLQRDVGAVQAEITDGLRNGKFVLFNEGETVFLMDHPIGNRPVKIRRSGSSETYWVARDAVMLESDRKIKN